MTIEELKDKWEKDPNSRIFLQLAEEYRKSSHFDDAIRVCLEGLKKHPSYSTARVTLARAYLGAKRLEDARREFEAVLAVVPDSLLANRYLGDIYYDAGRSQDALKRYKVVQMLSAGDEEVASRVQRLESGSVATPTRTAARPAIPSATPSPATAVAAPRSTTARASDPAIARAAVVEAPDDAGFMDLKIDESVILNADMISAALNAAGMSGAAGSSGKAGLSSSPPAPARPAPVLDTAENAAGRAAASAAANAAADEVGEMGLDDFSEFSSPTVMLNVADLGFLPGVGASERRKDSAPSGVIPAAAPSAAPPLAASVAAQRAQKYGINIKAEPLVSPPPIVPGAVPPTLPRDTAAATAAGAARASAGATRTAAGTAAPSSVPAPVAENVDEVAGMDDFSEFAAPTVMMNVSDLLKAAGPGMAGPPEGAVAVAASSSPVRPAQGAVTAAEAAPVWLSDDALAPPPSFEQEAMSAPPMSETAPAVVEADGGAHSLFEAPIVALAASGAGDRVAAVEATKSAAHVEAPEPAFGTQMIQVADLESLCTQYLATPSPPAGPGSATAAPPAAPVEPAVAEAEADEAFPSFLPPGGEESGGSPELSDNPFADLPPSDSEPAGYGTMMVESPFASSPGAELEEPAPEAAAARAASIARSAADRGGESGVTADAGGDAALAGAVSSVADGTSKTRGLLYLQQGQVEKAIENLEAYLASHPEDDEARARLRGARELAPRPAGVAAQSATDAEPSGKVAPEPGSGTLEAGGDGDEAGAAADSVEDRRKKMQKLSNWLSSLKKS